MCAHIGSSALTSQSFVACWSNDIFMLALPLCSALLDSSEQDASVLSTQVAVQRGERG